jgi:TRAP-type mannitol/chloroaromatic compound transport system permease large subunit
VLIPPLALIFLVLGTIFLGIATPTEGGAMGAVGALVMAIARRRIDLKLMRQAMETTMKLSCFVLFILIGSTVFSLSFQGVDGPKWVERLLIGLPGGQLGFLIVVNILIFFLAFFLDFFELSFIVIPLIGPVADKLGIDLVWFGVLLAVNMQTSFMHPPFGFALFYLRSVAPTNDYTDKVTGRSTTVRSRSCSSRSSWSGSSSRSRGWCHAAATAGRRSMWTKPSSSCRRSPRKTRTRPRPPSLPMQIRRPPRRRPVTTARTTR